jgi:Ca2+-binding EF-hand superfamily protein
MVYMDSNGSKRSIPECAKLVRFFDSDEDGILSYADFMQIVLPCDNNDLRFEVQRRSYSRVGRFDNLDYEIELGLSNIIAYELDLINRVEILVRDLERCPDYTPHLAYRTIDRYEEGKISKDILIAFFRQFGNYLSEAEIFAIIRRMDTDGDARIGFAEFVDFLKNQVNLDAPLTKPSVSEKKSKATGRRITKFVRADHRAD